MTMSTNVFLLIRTICHEITSEKREKISSRKRAIFCVCIDRNLKKVARLFSSRRTWLSIDRLECFTCVFSYFLTITHVLNGVTCLTNPGLHVFCIELRSPLCRIWLPSLILKPFVQLNPYP